MAKFFIWDEDTGPIEIEGLNVEEAIRTWFDHEAQEDARDDMITNGFTVFVARAPDLAKDNVGSDETMHLHKETFRVTASIQLECSKVG